MFAVHTWRSTFGQGDCYGLDLRRMVLGPKALIFEGDYSQLDDREMKLLPYSHGQNPSFK